MNSHRQRPFGFAAILLVLSIPALLAAKTSPESHWAFQPLRDSPPPVVAQEDWPRNDIDRFVLAALEANNLSPVGDAGRAILARRAAFVLTGLPPRPEALESYTADSGPGAFERYVDVLLASPRFGEAWARHWLDLARYADSNGKDRNVIFPHAWRYRDWVIDAFNNDKPYDRFVREQIAGDLLNLDTPGARDDALVATGFLTLGAKAFQETKQEKFAMDVIDEQIDVMSRTFLGLTVSCARCHDHKFDPLPTRDYYALAGIFLSSENLYGPGPLYINRNPYNTRWLPVGKSPDKNRAPYEAWRAQVAEVTDRVLKGRSRAYGLKRQVRGAVREREAKMNGRKFDLASDPELAAKQAESDAIYAEVDTLAEQRDALMASPPPAPGYAMALQDRETPEDCRLRIRGEYDSPGDTIARGQLTTDALPPLDAIPETQSGRLQLADWLVSSRNPLAARVMVNRVWHHLFGRGLVATVDNFGTTGEAPSHPELLDWLSARFVEDGWSLKTLIRRIVTSRTWQLASDHRPAHSKVDPGNTWLWRANLRRLEIEAFRDAVLTASGQLDLDPPESFFANIVPGKEYGPTGGNKISFNDEIAADRHRSVYLPVLRNELPEHLRLFDFADPDTVTGARSNRTIPAQALYLMNSPWIEQQSRATAEGLLALDLPGDRARVDRAWRTLFMRAPKSKEISLVEGWLRDNADNAPADAWTDVIQALFAGARFRYLE